MSRLNVTECLWPHIIRVLDEDRPNNVPVQTIFAVFKESIEEGEFCGLATAYDITQHPEWIFADLTGHRPIRSVTPDVGARRALKIIDQEGLDALPVLVSDNVLVGVITRASILEALLQREHALLQHSIRLKRLLNDKQKQISAWSERLSELHEASRALLSVLANTSLEIDLLNAGIEALSTLLQARYGAITLLDKAGQLKDFVHTGISPEQVQRIGHLPEGRGLLGVVIREDISLRLDDLSKDPRSAGFPPNHPPMKSLLAVPVSHEGKVYGRIYLCDKESGESFSANDEVLAQSFAHSLSLVLDNARELEEIKRARQSLDYMAHFDALTDLPNRTLFSDRAHQALSHAQRNEGVIAILFIDLDNFKVVNDTIGHTLGDVLLKKVSQRISNCLREDDTVARFGGDEFIVMLPDISEPQDAAKVAVKILETLAQSFDIEQHEIFVSASIGISIYPDNDTKIDGLLAYADSAMYHAKKLGKNNYQFFTAEMNISTQNYIKLEKNLRHALERDELVLHYQPQVDAQTGRIIGMEALLRWNSQELV